MAIYRKDGDNPWPYTRPSMVIWHPGRPTPLHADRGSGQGSCYVTVLRQGIGEERF